MNNYYNYMYGYGNYNYNNYENYYDPNKYLQLLGVNVGWESVCHGPTTISRCHCSFPISGICLRIGATSL